MAPAGHTPGAWSEDGLSATQASGGPPMWGLAAGGNAVTILVEGAKLLGLSAEAVKGKFNFLAGGARGGGARPGGAVRKTGTFRSSHASRVPPPPFPCRKQQLASKPQM
jgi:hypothetical protein